MKKLSPRVIAFLSTVAALMSTGAATKSVW